MNAKKKNLSWLTALLAAALLTVAFPLTVAADDDDPPGRVARLNYLQGSVSFQPAGEPDWVSAITNRPLTTGDRLWTDDRSRAELHTGSATIRLDSNTGFSFLNLDDRTVQIQLTEGTLDIRVQRLGRDEIFEVDTPNQAFSILRPGQYRLQASADGNSTFVTVRSGEGEATGSGQTYTVQSGQSGTFTGTDSLSADIYDAGNNDDFDNWGQGRDRRDDQSQSARYVSHDVVGYQDLDDYGSWRSESGYGNVWTPTHVASDWAPYRDGHWSWISPWGWTWVDDAPWGYAPFHYGRWVSLNGNWGWVPGPREIAPVYAPALVVFLGGTQFGNSGSQNRDGYGGNVGWFPLGPREVYVPSYNASRGYVDRVNVSNTTVNTTTITNVYNNQVTNSTKNTNVTYVNRTVRGGVTAVPKNAFTDAQPIAKAAVSMSPQQIAAAPVMARATVVPTRNSVLGNSAPTATRVAQPPAAILNRPVVAKTMPPPPPVAFTKQQQALAAHPGQPLARHEVEVLRPANVALEHPLVKQAPPGKPAAANTTRPPVTRPVVGAAKQPVSPPPVNKPANVPEANVQAEKARAQQAAQQQADRAREQQAAQQPADKARGQQDAQQQAAKAHEQQAAQEQADKTRAQQAAQQQADKARDQQAAQQQTAKAHEQQAAQEQADKARAQQAAQQQADKARDQQAAQQQAAKAHEQQLAQEQADKARAQQAAQQQADKARDQQAAQQQADKARAQQAAQQQADKARDQQAAKAHEQQLAQEQADKARAQQAAQQQAEKASEQQLAQQQAARAHEQQLAQEQADKARAQQAAQQRSDRPPTATAAQPPKAQPPKPAEAAPNPPLTPAEKAREEQKKREEKPSPQ